MAKTPQTPSQGPRNPSEKDSLGVLLSFEPTSATAIAGSTATAVAKVSQGSELGDGYWVQFTINGGTAVFTKPDADTQGKQATIQAGGMGRAYADFTDQVGEPVSITATVVKYPDGSPYNDGPSDTETFTFTGQPHDYSLSFTTPALANNQPAVTGTDEGQVVVTDNGGRLKGDVVVVFTFTQGSAQFVTSGDPYIQAGSSPTQLLVKTHYDSNLGKDIANASFTDAAVGGDSVTLKGALQVDPSVHATQDFTFAAEHAYSLSFVSPPPSNNQLADGASADQGRAIVTDNGGRLSAPVIVHFTFTQGSARFVTSGDPNIQGNSTSTDLYVQTHYDAGLGKDIADAFFTDSTAGGDSVTLKGALVADADANATQDFTFKAAHDYGLSFVSPPPSNNQLADGASADQGRAIVTDNGGRLSAPVIVHFTFTQGSARFVTSGDPNIQGNSTSTDLYVQTHYDAGLGKDIADAFFTDSTQGGDSVTLKGALVVDADANATQGFTFKAAHDYGLTFTTPAPANNQPAVTGTDQGQAVVTDYGGRLKDNVVVVFTFDSGSAQFVTSGDPNIQSGSSPTKLRVMTHYDAGLGKDIANASFTDATAAGDSVTLRGALEVDSNVSATQGFSFSPVAHTINLYPALDGAASDTSSQNRVLAAVLSGGNVDGTYSGSVTFTADPAASVTFAGVATGQSLNVSTTNGFAEASFSTAQVETAATTTVKITATLVDGTAPQSDPLGFTFFAGGTWFDTQLAWQNSSYNDNYNDWINAYYQFNAIIDPGAHDLYLCLSTGSSATFSSGDAAYVNDKVSKVANANISPNFLPIHVMDEGAVESVDLTVTAPGLAPSATTKLNFGQS